MLKMLITIVFGVVKNPYIHILNVIGRDFKVHDSAGRTRSMVGYLITDACVLGSTRR